MRKEDKSKNILFIYSCLQDEALLQSNIAEIFKSVSEIGDGANIYVLSSRDTLKLILPDNVHFFVEKITTYRIKEIVKKYGVKSFDGACFLCSEDTPEQCHRRLLAEYLQKHSKETVQIVHLI